MNLTIRLYKDGPFLFEGDKAIETAHIESITFNSSALPFEDKTGRATVFFRENGVKADFEYIDILDYTAEEYGT